MSDNQNPHTRLIPAAKLYRKTSANGNEYFVGRLGGLRVLVMLNTHRSSDDDASHVLLIGEAQQNGNGRRGDAGSR